jgi:lipid-A-disaccharide synthase
LVNIVAGEAVVPELLQWKVTPERIARAASALIDNLEFRKAMSSKLGVIRERLGEKGASKRVAQRIYSMIK